MTEPCTLLVDCSFKVNVIALTVWILLCIPGIMYLYAIYASWKEKRAGRRNTKARHT